MGTEVNQGFDQFIKDLQGDNARRIAVQGKIPKRYGKLFKAFQDAHRLHWRRARLIPDTDNRPRLGYNKPNKATLLVYMLEIGRKDFEKEIESLLK